jgi:hypothetical protein
MNLRLISYSASSPGASGAAAAAFTGDSLTIENNMGEMRPVLLSAWGFQSTDGFQQIAFPSGHDTTRGYRASIEANETDPIIPIGLNIPVTAQEQLSITIAGSASVIEQGSALIFYPNLPGVSGRYIHAAEVDERMEKMTTINCTITGSANAYSQELITAESDLLMANRDYAVLGIRTTVNCLSAYIIGPDTGNVKVGVPGGEAVQWCDTRWFYKLSEETGLPCVPVINSGNRANTFVGIAQKGATDVPLSLILALLA